MIADLRDEFGDRLRYVYRHRPVAGSDIARRAAELAERPSDPDQFWSMHVELMTRSEKLTEEDLRVVAAKLDIAHIRSKVESNSAEHARNRVDADENSANASGVQATPTFFINNRSNVNLPSTISLVGDLRRCR